MAEDPLRLLAAAVANKRDVRMLRDGAVVQDLAEATHFSLPGLADPSARTTLAADTPTRYRVPGSKDRYDLRALVSAHLARGASVAEYLAKARAASVQFVSVVARKKLTDYLDGVRPLDDGEAEPEDDAGVSAAVVDGRPAKRAKYTVNKDDVAAVKAILALQEPRQLSDRKRVLRGAEPNNFDIARTLALDRLAAAKEEQKRSALPIMPQVAAASKRRMDPIIIVPPSSSALITMQNVKAFLEDGTFQPNQANAPRGAEDIVAVMHARAVAPGTAAAATKAGAGGVRKARYLVVDDVAVLEKFGDEAWDRVVCVVTTGQEWQFRPYKWSEPKELFHHVRGICFQYSNAPANDKVKGWNVAELRIDPVKRHVDKSVVAEFWRIVEHHVAHAKAYLVH